MALVKCPRCELNYILDGDKLCTVCRREVRGEVTEEVDDLTELCSECGEAPVVPGSELCITCLKDLSRRVSPVSTDDSIDVIVPEEAVLEIDSVSGMDEIQIDDIPEDLDEEDFADELDEEFADDESDEDEDDDLFDR